MVSMDAMPTMRDFLAIKLASLAKGKGNIATHARTRIQTTVKFMMHVAGLGCLTLAGFSWNMSAGLIVGGLSFLILSTWFTGSATPPANPMLRRRDRA